jgi:hypothetical protein
VPAKCAMCGNEAIISEEHDSDKNEKKQQEVETSNIIIEHIGGTRYTFDTADCALMFKKFNAVYGSNFAE